MRRVSRWMRWMRPARTFGLSRLGLILVWAVSVAAEEPAVELPLVFQEDFEHGLAHWEPTDAAAWKLVPGEGGQVLSLFQASQYRPPHRSPYNITLARDLYVGDFDLLVKVRSTSRVYDHQDLCLFFGYQDAAHFYYVHLGRKPDPHAHQIFVVNEAPRTMISTQTSDGIAWDDGWHEVKISRRVASGQIDVFFDDLTKPILRATDKTFPVGRVGLGSFDDVGEFDDLRLYGPRQDRPGASR